MGENLESTKGQKDTLGQFMINNKIIEPISTQIESEKYNSNKEFMNFKQFSSTKTENSTFKFKIKRKNKSHTPYYLTAMSNLKNSRSFGMSQYQSSYSLRNSIQSFTFNKEDKFKDSYRGLLTESIYNIPDQKNLRYTSLGFGKKYDLMPLEGRGVPGPNYYNIKSHIEIMKEKKKGALIYSNTHPTVNILWID